ncbi:MAG: acetoacetate--CoA ligase [Acidimicrobiia bacterium]|nr:acetoacetate--CoA ligase [Acidimicrobiia bacterium]
MPPLWTPDATRVETARLTAFARGLGRDPSDYAGLHALSVEDPDGFWEEVWRFCGVRGDPGATVYEPAPDMMRARFFPDARLNFAENLLRREDESAAVVFAREDGLRRTWSWAELRGRVAALRGALVSAGIGPGDRVAAWMPNSPEAVAVLLAAAAVGATFSSTSPDFGTSGVVDRFGQIEPRVLFGVDAYLYGGKEHDCLGRLGEIEARIPAVERTVVVPHVDPRPDVSRLRNGVLWDDFIANGDDDLEFEPLPFDHPLVILYSSGTTGIPKCIVHRAGGILLQHLKEHGLHGDIRPGDRLFYFTTTGWMMWNWLTSALASGATIVLYDGSPFHPDPHVLFDLADEVGVTHFGTSAKWIDAIAKAGLEPARTHDLGSVRTLFSTGSPLAPEGFDYVYGSVKADVHLASISGGTDLCGTLVGGNPTAPVWRGEIQCAALGMDIRVFEADGSEAPTGTKGEIVCTRPFPSMPLRFWGDGNGSRYRRAYFERFPGVWNHGDFVSATAHGGYVVHGRSDATLNPGGVRIGTAEIYRVVEQFDEVLEAIVVGQEWGSDTRVVLFVRLAPGIELDDALVARIKARIREETTPRHVPARVLAVPDIPRTKSGKITELTVRDVIHGREVLNTDALANPEALDHFRNRPELGD